ncbi:MAG: CotH kinase family protein [Paludibacteraceae bacterium]|nr:CotH kinase family protein [Paludibacteraceae bacterium]
MKKIYSFLLLCMLALTLQATTYSGTLPIMYIQTENNAPIVSKDDYLNATYYVDALGISGYENIGSAAAPLTMEIKGRGNYTWTGFNKKPYRIKLTEKQSLLGMKKSKHFALLAHADDALNKKGFMRNQVGFELSRLIGISWTPETKPVEVVLNGDYIGLYFLTETIRVDKDRVNIVEQADEETDSVAITGGWLVEIDNYDTDPHVTIKEGDEHTMWFTYKTPEVLSKSQEDFLMKEMLRIDGLVYGDKNSDQLWQYLDMDALARFYIVQEIMDNYESFHGSCYLYREIGDGQKWKFGPVWDFGSSFNRSKSLYLYEGDVWHNHWIPEICQFPVFMECVKKIWNEFYPTKFNNIFTFTSEQLTLLKSAAVADANRWSEYNGNADLTKRINNVNTWLRSSTAWLNEQWGSGGSAANPEYNPDSVEQTIMYVWQNGKQIEYNVAQVDSITFAKKDKGIVVKAKVPANWKETIYVWIWGDGITTYEHVAMKQGDWYVFAYEGEELNIIFKQREGWTGHPNQSEDIYTTRSACYILTQDGEEKAQVTEVDCP